MLDGIKTSGSYLWIAYTVYSHQTGESFAAIQSLEIRMGRVPCGRMKTVMRARQRFRIVTQRFDSRHSGKSFMHHNILSPTRPGQ